MSVVNVGLAIYINLDDREDRRHHMEQQLKNCKWPKKRLSATRIVGDPESNGLKMIRRLQGRAGVASIWISHLRALKDFVQHANHLADETDSYVLFEDDVTITSNDLWESSLVFPKDLPSDWEVVLFSPKYRWKNKEIAPIDEKDSYFAKLPPDGSVSNLNECLSKYIITGAHFCVFRNKFIVSKVIECMNLTSELYDVDEFYVKNFKIYGIQDIRVQHGGFGSDHN